jgi:hypothetical protein
MSRGMQNPWRKCNSCGRKAISITYSECVTVDLGIQQAMRMRHIVICVLFGSTIFIHIVKGTEPTRCDKVCSFIASTSFGHQYAHHRPPKSESYLLIVLRMMGILLPETSLGNKTAYCRI